jgi:arylsulfatase A-like enzyme
MALAIAAHAETKRPPNIVLIVTDDGGWADFGFNGCKDYPTPNMDTIAKEGVNFTAGYVTAPVCSPSRAGLLAGRNQSRFGHEYNITGQRTQGLPLSETLISQRFKKLGYTTAAFGKWHLGGGKGYQPFERGFDVSYGFIGGARGYLAETLKTPRDTDDAWRRNGIPEVEREYATDAIRRECVDFIGKNSDRPFFIYAAFTCPHSPMEAKPGYESGFANITNKKRRTIAAMMKSQDEAVGEILAVLKAKNLDKDTIIWLLNDNGAGTYAPFDNGPWRGKKGGLFEGGIRVAFAARWPGHFPKGLVYQEAVTSLDISSTSLAAAGSKDMKDLDGKDLLPYLNSTDKSAKPHESLNWSYHPAGVIRHGDWKLLLMDGKPAALFNLKEDPSETTNRLNAEPDRAAELAAKHADWKKSTVAPLWRADSEGLLNEIRKTHKNP